MTLAIVFPGQGSQSVGMGKDLFDRYPEMVEIADSTLGYSLRDLCLNDPNNAIGHTEFTQPALYSVNAMYYRRHIDDGGAEPDFLAGHSLGEYNALLAAEAFDFEAGLRLVQKRGALMGEVDGGGMAAVIGLEAPQIFDIISKSQVTSVNVANFNALDQTVLSGPAEDLDRLRSDFEAKGARFVRINVKTAFHSRYMRPVAEQFRLFLGKRQFAPLVIPVLANFSALPYRDNEIANHLVRQIDHPVRWVESVQYIVSELEPRPEFIECGPGKVLTRLIENICRHPAPVNIARRY